MELDDAEEAEVGPGHRGRAGRRRSRPARPGQIRRGRPTFTTTSPKWWMHGRVFGGMVVAQALNAAMRTVPAWLRGPLPPRLLPAPDQPGVADDPRRGQRARRAIVQHPAGDQRGRGQGDVPDDVLVSRPRRTVTATSFPLRPRFHRPATSRGSRHRSPSTSASSGTTERREDGTYRVDPPLLVPHP